MRITKGMDSCQGTAGSCRRGERERGRRVFTHKQKGSRDKKRRSQLDFQMNGEDRTKEERLFTFASYIRVTKPTF